MSASTALAILGFAALAKGCFAEDTGYTPPLNAFNYPTGLVLSPGKTTLYVVNSDFDLEFNGGTVFTLDLQAMNVKLRGLLAALNHSAETPAAGCEGVEGAVNQACCGFGSEAHPADKRSFVNENAILNPGPCRPLPVEQLIGNSAIIGAFASGAVLLSRPPDALAADDRQGARLFVPVRGDPSLTFFDTADDRSPSPTCSGHASAAPLACLECQRSEEERCTSKNQVGVAPFDNTRQLILPVEPVGIAAAEDGEAIVIAHQTEKAVSLAVNRWPGQFASLSIPTLEYVARGLPDGPNDVAAIPVPGLVRVSQSSPSDSGPRPLNYEPGFLVTYRAAAQIDLFRYHADKGGAPPRPFLARVQATPITVNASGKDSRGIAIDASERRACEAPCIDANTTCLTACAGMTDELRAGCAAACQKASFTCLGQRACLDIPLEFFVANRTPASLLLGKIETRISLGEDGQPTGVSDEVSIQDTVPLTFGASRVVVGTVINKDGNPEPRVFVAAFESRIVFSYDPKARRIDTVIRTGRGPHALAADGNGGLSVADPYAFLYIGHFTDSYLGVVDLDMRHTETFGTMFASIGTPKPPQESK